MSSAKGARVWNVGGKRRVIDGPFTDVKELLGTMDALQREFQSPVLVEEFVEGREFYVGVLGNVSPVAFPVIDRMRSEMLHRVGLSDLLHPARLA